MHSSTGSFRGVRSSKFRHAYATTVDKEKCFSEINVTTNLWDSTFCTVNPKFLAVAVESVGGGAIIVLPHSIVGRVPANYPLVAGHKGPVLDIAFCPHCDNVIASASEDTFVRVWNIPDGGIEETLHEPNAVLSFHKRRATMVVWHPTARGVLLSAGSDKQVVIWNVNSGAILTQINSHPDFIFTACFNWNGSKLLTTCKDKILRIFDSRTGQCLSSSKCHEGTKKTCAIFLRDGRILTTGFDRSSKRQYSIRNADNLDTPGTIIDANQAHGTLYPLYDPDINILYLCGKGDSVVRFYEITNEMHFIHYINSVILPDAQRGICIMPKRGCNVNICEIGRLYRLSRTGLCQIINIIVPRKTRSFQADIYPDTQAEMPAQEAIEWKNGKIVEPALCSLQSLFMGNEQSLTTVRNEHVLSKLTMNFLPLNEPLNSTTKIEPEEVKAHQKDRADDDDELKSLVSKLVDELRKQRSAIKKLEERIAFLEGKIATQNKGFGNNGRPDGGDDTNSHKKNIL